MGALHYFHVDWIHCKNQLKYIVIFTLAAAALMYANGKGGIFGGLYLAFIAIFLSGQPFNLDQVSESGFLNMLPGTTKERVAGRFYYGLSLLLCTTLMGFLIMLIMRTKEGLSVSQIFEVTLLLFAAGLMVISLQFILFYVIGKGKSQQFMGIIRILPGFVMFFGANALAGKVSSIDLEWVMQHQMALTLLAVLAGIVIFDIGIRVSAFLIRHRDFN